MKMEEAVIDNSLQFLAGGGEMGELTRLYNWDSTSLGAPGKWPQSLRTVLGIVLHSKFPMFLWWGPELICFYNNAYHPSLGKDGKHPSILGMPAEKAWPEIWHIIYPLIEQVMKGGGATWSEDQLIPIYRNGKIEDVYWTFSYSPVNDEAGTPAGVLVICTETTDKVTSFKQLKESQNQLQFTLEAAELGTWDLNPVTGKFIGNDRLKEWFGLPLSEDIDLSLAISRIIEKDRQRVLDAINSSLQITSNGNYDIEYTVKHPVSNIERTVRAKGKALFTNKNVAYRFSGTLQDVTSQIITRQLIEENEKRFRNVANNAPVLIWTTNSETPLRNFFNKAWLSYTGKTMEQEMGKGWSSGVYKDDLDRCMNLYETAVSKKEEFYMEYRLKRYDGEYRWVSSHGVPRFADDGSFEGYIGACIDIHEKTLYQTHLKESEERLQELDKQKDYFISIASHELKTPITSIKGYVQILQNKYETTGDDFLINSLNVVNKQINTLTNLVAELLDLSKIRVGQLSLNRKEFSINHLIKKTIEEIQHINADYTIHYEQGGIALVNADEERIGQVLNNLLTNAIKYAPGSNKINVVSKIVDKVVWISVEDFGIGITKEEQERIFERFYRVEGQSEKTFPGFGIGLFIASEIIQRHQGSIHVKSEPGKGSVFYFFLPVVN